jgi:TIR domain
LSAGIPKEGFRNSEQLDVWLKSLPKKTRLSTERVLAVRAAFRTTPFATRITSVAYERNSVPFDLVLSLFRALLAARVTLNHPTVDIIRHHGVILSAASAAAMSAAADAYHSSDDARKTIAIRSVAVSAARCASHAADSFLTGLLDDYSRDEGDEELTTFGTHAVYEAANAMPHAVARQGFWLAVTRDAELLDRPNENTVVVLESPLWHDAVPKWWDTGFAKMKAVLAVLDNRKGGEAGSGGWSVWTDWLQARVNGSEGWRLSAKDANTIEERIALGFMNSKFWKREPETINGEIAEWLTDAGWKPDVFPQTISLGASGIFSKGDPTPNWDFFLSYTETDLPTARLVSDTLEEAGYSVFSQFNDMSKGNLIDHMNRGLEGMSRFLAIYSPAYFGSSACKAEWTAALTDDHSGSKEKFIPFVAQKVGPPKLLKAIIYHPLFNLDEAAKKETILRAVREPLAPKERVAQRQAAKEAASPSVMADASGNRLDAGANKLFDAPYVDADLLQLPERLRALIGTLMSSVALGDNQLQGLKAALRAYADELDARGTGCILGILKDQFEMIEACASEGLSSIGMQAGYDRFCQLHEALCAHFPLDQTRMALFRAALVDPNKLNDQTFAAMHNDIVVATREAADKDEVTDQYLEIVEKRVRFASDVANAPDPAVLETEDLDFRVREEDRLQKVREFKKGVLVQEAAFADKTLDVASKITTVTDSRTVPTLLVKLRKFADWIWSS